MGANATAYSITSKRTIQQTRLGPRHKRPAPVPTTCQVVRGRLISCLTYDGSGRRNQSAQSECGQTAFPRFSLYPDYAVSAKDIGEPYSNFRQN